VTKKRLAAFFAAILAAIGLWTKPKPPQPLPGPSPTPEASASPSASPGVSPLPTPPLAYLCQLEPSQEPMVCTENPSDPPDYPQFQDAVMSAQDMAEENGFVKDGLVRPSTRAYTSEVTRLLRVMGYCATNELLEDEVMVKNSNSFSESYDIVTSHGQPWTKYAAICRHARF